MKQTIAINSQTHLGELVTYFTAITSRLNELHIDYCCQGARTLEAAIKKQALHLISLLRCRMLTVII